MNESKAKTAIVASVGGAAVLAVLDAVAHDKRPPLSVGVGAAVAGLMLLALAEAAPEVAAGLAVLLFVGSVLSNGSEAFAALSQTYSKGK